MISPLLANIALHGLEEAVQAAFPKRKMVGGVSVPWTPTVVRYADDFVVCHPDREVVQQCQAIVQQWLSGMGLELKPSKTRITHTLQEYGGQVGFDFLGFHIRQYRVGRNHSGRGTRGKPLGFKTIIKPSKGKVVLHQRRLTDIVRQMKGQSQQELIRRLNPIIKGWSNYYRGVVNKATFGKVDGVLYHALRRWAYRRHPKKGRGWIVRKYWHFPHWVFGPKEGPALLRHDATKIERHVKVQGARSPFDGDWVYWVTRRGQYPGVSLWLGWVIRRQGGRCAHCGLYFTPTGLLEVHHVKGPSEKVERLVVLHRHCHDAVHGKGSGKSKGSAADNGQPCEEPDERERVRRGTRC